MKNIILFLTLTLSIVSWAQTSPPPLYDDEDKPIDLAPEREKKKAIKKPEAKAETPLATTTPETKPPSEPTPSAPTSATPPAQSETTVPTPIPSPVKAPATTSPTPPAPTPPSAPPAQTQTSAPTSLPATAPVETQPTPPATPIAQTVPAAVPPPPTITPPPPTVTELPPDGGPKKDAGSDLTSALPVTFQKYEENTLSTKDTADTYKLYSRAGEGIGVILIPSDPSMQLSVSLLGESGELLTQTQAAQAGLPLAFQTSTLEVNKIIYVQIKDLSLAAQTPSDLTKKYSLELKPIAPTTAPPPPAPLAQPQPQQAEVTQPTPPVVPAAPTEAAPQAKEEVKAEAKPEVQEPKKTSSLRSRLSQNKKVLYGIVGVGFLVILLVVLMVVRKTRKKADQQAA